MQKIGYMMKNNPYISVIITAYNRKDFLLDAFNSALNQTLSRDKYEIIVTKNFTYDKIDNYIKKNGGKLVSFEGGSYGEQIADALKYAKGQVICFLDDDDLFMKEKLEYIYNAFLENKSLIYINNARTYIDDKGNYQNKSPSKFEKREKDIIIKDFNKKPVALLRIQQYANPWFNNSSTAIRKVILKHFRNALYSIKFAQDSFYYFISLISGDLLISNKALTKYRVHESTSASIINYESYKKTILKFESKDMVNIILSKTKAKINKELQKYFYIFSKDQEITYLFYAGNYRKKALLDYLQIFPYIIRAFPKSAILRGLQVAFYIVAPEWFRRFNYQRTKKYIGNLQ